MALNINIPKYGNVFFVGDTFAELRSVSPLKIENGFSAILAGGLTRGDGLGGIYYWDDSSTAPDDDETILAPIAGGTGRWLKIAVGQYGPRGDIGPIGNTGAKGDPGAAGNVDATLASLKAAATTDVMRLYDGAPFVWTLGNFTGLADNINIVKADSTALTVGAWVRQSAGKVTYTGSGSNPATIALSEKAGQFVTTKGKAGTFLDQLNAIGADFAAGGAAYFPKLNGTQTLTEGFTFSGQRINLHGDGPNASIIQFNPAAPGSALTLNTAGAGGQYQSAITGFGFTSANTVDKVAIDLVNVANVNIERIGIGGSSVWGGNSIAIRTRGRQMIRIKDCDIACARPLVISPNATFPTIAGDYTAVLNTELIATAAGGAPIEVENGVVLSNLVVRDTALVGGLDGFRMLKTDPTGIGVNGNLQFENIRTEQGTSPTGWSFNIDTGVDTLQSILFSNLLLDSHRNGIKLRNAQRVTMIGVNFNKLAENAHVALDMVGVPGTVLTLINCWGQIGSTLNLVNMKRVQGLVSDVSSAIGPVEVWVYDPSPAFLGTATTCRITATKPLGSRQLVLANAEKRLLIGAGFCGQMLVATQEGPSCRFAIYSVVAHHLPSDDLNARFSAVFGTATKHNLQYDGAGSEGAGIYLENASGGSASYSFTLMGSGW